MEMRDGATQDAPRRTFTMKILPEAFANPEHAKELEARILEETDLHLSPNMNTLVLRERDHAVAALRAEADRIASMDANEYIAEGLHRESVHEFELVGRMTKKGVIALHYDQGAPRWVFLYEGASGNFEGPRPPEVARELFADT